MDQRVRMINWKVSWYLEIVVDRKAWQIKQWWINEDLLYIKFVHREQVAMKRPCFIRKTIV